MTEENNKIRETKEKIIKAGRKAIEQLIKVAEEEIITFENDIAVDKLKNAAATKKLAILDAFEILQKITEEENVLNEVVEEDTNKGKKQTFVGRRAQ